MHEPDVVRHCYVRRNSGPKRSSDLCYHSYTKQDKHTPIQTDDEEATKASAKAVSRRIGIPTFTRSSIFKWKPWSHRAIHTNTLGTTSNFTNTDGRQIFEVADYNDSPDCRLGHPTSFLDSDTILTTCRRENFIRTTMATTIRISIVHLLRNGSVCRTDEGLTETRHTIQLRHLGWTMHDFECASGCGW